MSKKVVFRSIFIFLSAAVFMLSGCAGQPVVWNKAGGLDLTKGGKVSVKAAPSCSVPPESLVVLQGDIQSNVSSVFTGDREAQDAYSVEVTITEYDEGNAFARFMLIGLGQMYLYGDVVIMQGLPPVVVREGGFKKNFCAGGLIGAAATMQKDVLPKVGKSIAEAIKSNL